MTPTEEKTGDEEIKTGLPVFHLVHSTSDGKPLCGDTSSDALIGSYVEHLDENPSDGVHWIREVFDGSGKPVVGCLLCLARFPSAFLDFAPHGAGVNDNQFLPSPPTTNKTQP